MQKSEQPSKRLQKVSLLEGKILYDNVLIKPFLIQEEKGAVTIVKPQQYEDKPEWGEVLAVGHGRLLENGHIEPLQVKVGDLVLFQKYSSMKFRHHGEDFMTIKEEDIFFVSSK